MLALILIFIGVLFRFVVHIPNFTPVIAIVLFGSVFLRKGQSLWLPLILMAVSDLFLGFHAVIPFTWGALFLAACWGRIFRENINVSNVFYSSIGGAFIFFVISNLGAWLTMYPKTFAGLIDCYIMAIPFFRQTFFSTLVYSAALFGVYVFAAKKIKSTRFAWVLE